MSKIVYAVIATLLAGMAVGAWILGDTAPVAVRSQPAPGNFDDAASLDERLQRLERVIAEERNARLVLEDELLALYEQVEGLELTRNSTRAGRLARTGDAEARTAEVRRPRDFASRMRVFQERRLTQLVAGGFSEDEARRLLQLESEAQYKAMQAGHEARRNGDRIDPFAGNMNPQSILREELGDAEYERYLMAQGQRSSVQVSHVLEGSPGSKAGLQAGDEIVSYNGARTFSMLDVRELTLQGETGEDVVIEINRDGVRMQLSIPRGPIGMNGSGALIRGIGGWGG